MSSDGPDPEEAEIVPVAFQPRAPDPEPERWRPSLQQVLLGAAALVALIGVWFSLTAVSVRVRSEPETDRVSFPGTLLELDFGDRTLLRSTSHDVLIEKDGYYPLEETIDVSDEPDQTFTFELVKLPGLLSLTTTPVDGARVLIDGKEVGTTPLVDAEVRPGRHALGVLAPRHLEHRGTLEIEGGGVKQALEVALTPAWAPVTLSTAPEGAVVFVDGEEMGTTPGTFEVGQGTRNLELSLPRYKTHRSLLAVEANVAQTLPEITLQPADGRLVVETDPPGAQLSVGDAYPGNTPLSIELAPGRAHELTFFKPGYEIATRRVELASEEERTLRVRMAPRMGVVVVSAKPAGAQLAVDGKPVGAADQQLELLAVPHELRITLAGHADAVATVTPQPGQTRRIDVKLLTKAEHRRVATPDLIITGQGQELVRIDPGRLVMGTPRGTAERRANETPRPVELTRPFFLGVREVSNREFRAFRPEHRTPSHTGGSLDGDDQPVAGISWEDAARFCNWLSARDGLPPAYVERGGVLEGASPMTTGYRLPSEAEWAWVARFGGNGQERVFPWGSGRAPARFGNYADVSASGILPDTMRNYEDGAAVSAPVGFGQPNPAGVRDLGGNVAEWIHDYYTIYPPTRGSTAAKDPLGPRYGQSHVIRGGSWQDGRTSRLRLAYRDYAAEPRDDVGFRLARSVD